VADEYYAQVYLRDCGEMIVVSTEADLDSDPVLGTITVRFIKPDPE
jgi:hypothetical protein